MHARTCACTHRHDTHTHKRTHVHMYIYTRTYTKLKTTGKQYYFQAITTDIKDSFIFVKPGLDIVKPCFKFVTHKSGKWRSLVFRSLRGKLKSCFRTIFRWLTINLYKMLCILNRIVQRLRSISVLNHFGTKVNLVVEDFFCLVSSCGSHKFPVGSCKVRP